MFQGISIENFLIGLGVLVVALGLGIAYVRAKKPGLAATVTADIHSAVADVQNRVAQLEKTPATATPPAPPITPDHIVAAVQAGVQAATANAVTPEHLVAAVQAVGQTIASSNANMLLALTGSGANPDSTAILNSRVAEDANLPKVQASDRCPWGEVPTYDIPNGGSVTSKSFLLPADIYEVEETDNTVGGFKLFVTGIGQVVRNTPFVVGAPTATALTVTADPGNPHSTTARWEGRIVKK